MPKKLRTLFIIAFSFDLFLLIGTWIHRIFVTDLNPLLGSILLLVSMTLIIVLAIVYGRRLIRQYKGSLPWGPADLFFLGFLIFLIGGFFSTFFNGRSTLDIQLHDTYFVIAHAHVMGFIALLCLIFSGVYYFFERIFGRPMNVRIGYLHFALTFAASFGLAVWEQYQGMAGMPRRYLDYNSLYSTEAFRSHTVFQAKSLFLLLLAQIIFLGNLIYSIIRTIRIRR